MIRLNISVCCGLTIICIKFEEFFFYVLFDIVKLWIFKINICSIEFKEPNTV